MDSQQLTQLFTGVTGLIILIVFVVWPTLTFLAPFFLYSIARSNKKILAELWRKELHENPSTLNPSFNRVRNMSKLINCPGCEAEIGSNAYTRPICGYKRTNPVVWLLVITIAVVLVLTIFGS
jgi:hypothetical protein